MRPLCGQVLRESRRPGALHQKSGGLISAESTGRACRAWPPRWRKRWPQRSQRLATIGTLSGASLGLHVAILVKPTCLGGSKRTGQGMRREIVRARKPCKPGDRFPAICKCGAGVPRHTRPLRGRREEYLRMSARSSLRSNLAWRKPQVGGLANLPNWLRDSHNRELLAATVRCWEALETFGNAVLPTNGFEWTS